jgi:hypothetical protein
MSKNLVILTCAVFVKENTVFPTEVRIKQILLSIESIRQKVPNPYIVLLEVGSISQDIQDFLTERVDEYICMNVSHLNKNQGEATMMYTYLSSDSFREKSSEFASLSKLSGRYFLSNEFDFQRVPLEKPWIKHRIGSRGENIYETRYFRMPISYVPHFYQKYDEFMKNNFQMLDYDDVEHIYVSQDFIRMEDSVYTVKIGVAGWVSGSGDFLVD